MQVKIKQLGVAMDIKSKGMELEIRDTSGSHLGDVVVTMTGVTWCKGRTQPENGVKVTWAQFIELMAAQAKK